MSRGTTYNIVYDDESWEKVDKQNKILLDDFINYKKSSDKAKGTLDQYFQVIRLFLLWNLEHNENRFFIDIKKRELIRFFNYVLTDLSASPNRVITIRSILSSFSNYIVDILDEEYPNYKNIVKKIETVAKEAVREKTILSQEMIDGCLQKLVDDEKYQIACFMALAVASGARKSELLRFKPDFFVDENIVFGSLYRTPKIVTKGRGSRGKLLNKFVFVKQFKPYFDMWMKQREELNIESEYLFVIKRETGYEQASVHNADNWAATISKHLGCNFYCHSLRHMWTTELKRKNVPDDVIQELCGWTSREMVSLYSDLEISDTLGMYFDADGIKEDVKFAKLSDL